VTTSTSDYTAFTVTIRWDPSHPRYARAADPDQVARRIVEALSADWLAIRHVSVVYDDDSTPDLHTYLLGVHWDTDDDMWDGFYWPAIVDEELHRQVRRWDAATGLGVVGHEDPGEPVVEVDTTPPRPPYRPDRPGGGPESHGQPRP
jgi:hypothetical protein